MKLYFSHGKESGPWGTKIKRLAPLAEARGFDVDSIDYTDTPDPDARAARLGEILAAETDEIVLAGSSMGGYVSVVAARQTPVRGIFLMAPALYIPGWQHQEYRPQTAQLEIVHGWSDKVIPPEHSIRFAEAFDCSLHLISGDHALNDSLVEVEALFEHFLNVIQRG